MSAEFEEQTIFVKLTIIADSLLNNNSSVINLFMETVNSHIPYKFYLNYDYSSLELVLDAGCGIGRSFIQGNVRLSY